MNLQARGSRGSQGTACGSRISVSGWESREPHRESPKNGAVLVPKIVGDSAAATIDWGGERLMQGKWRVEASISPERRQGYFPPPPLENRNLKVNKVNNPHKHWGF